MAEISTNPGKAEEYWQIGGRLDKYSFDKAMRVLTSNGKPLPVKKSSLSQAENMASFSHVSITEKQQYLYAVLREMTRKTEGRSYFPSEIPGTVPAWALTDQPLLAEVLRLTDKEMLDIFKLAYPNIWVTA